MRISGFVGVRVRKRFSPKCIRVIFYMWASFWFIFTNKIITQQINFQIQIFIFVDACPLKTGRWLWKCHMVLLTHRLHLIYTIRCSLIETRCLRSGDPSWSWIKEPTVCSYNGTSRSSSIHLPDTCMRSTSVFGPIVSLRNVRPEHVLTAADHMVSPLLWKSRTLEIWCEVSTELFPRVFSFLVK